MTEEKAIELATQYQKKLRRPTRIASVRRIGKDLIDAFVEACGKKDPSERPEWLRLEPHWAVSFERELKMVPRHYSISVYDDGYVTEVPAL